jgi:selenophosphate synthetase-related protein
VDIIGMEAGRKRHKGFYVDLLAKKAREKGIHIRKIPIKTKMNIKQFILKYPKGRFVLTRRGHAFCAIDGKIYDIIPNGKSCIVKSIYKVKSNRMKYIQEAVKKIK